MTLSTLGPEARLALSAACPPASGSGWAAVGRQLNGRRRPHLGLRPVGCPLLEDKRWEWLETFCQWILYISQLFCIYHLDISKLHLICCIKMIWFVCLFVLVITGYSCCFLTITRNYSCNYFQIFCVFLCCGGWHKGTLSRICLLSWRGFYILFRKWRYMETGTNKESLFDICTKHRCNSIITQSLLDTRRMLAFKWDKLHLQGSNKWLLSLSIDWLVTFIHWLHFAKSDVQMRLLDYRFIVYVYKMSDNCEKYPITISQKQRGQFTLI